MSTDREISFGRLYERSLRLANALLGVAGKGDRIGILAENVPEYVEAYYGVPAAGMALTFLNYRLNPKEWAYILNNAEARVLLVDREYVEKIEPVLSDIASIEHVIVIGGSGEGGLVSYDDFVGAAQAAKPPVEVDEDDTAWLIYTSGTTGFPKGAMLTHRNLVAAALESVIEYQPSPSERTLMAFPLCHVAGYIVPVTHMRGGLIVLDARRTSPSSGCELVDEYRITGSGLAPTMVNFLLQHPKIRRIRPVEPHGHRLRRGSHAGRGVALRDRSLRTDRVLRLRDDRARRQRAHVPEGGARPRHPTATSTSWRRAARRCASPTSRSSTKT